MCAEALETPETSLKGCRHLCLRREQHQAGNSELETHLQAGLQAEIALGTVADDEIVSEIRPHIIRIEEANRQPVGSLEIHAATDGQGKGSARGVVPPQRTLLLLQAFT